MATSSSGLPLGTAEGGSTASTSAADEGKVRDVPLLSCLQLVKRRRVKGEAPVRAGSRTPESADRRTTIDDLPDDLMVEIFSHMNLSENINILQRVCSRWKRLAQDAHLWRHKTYVVSYDASDEEAIAAFAAAPELRTVIVEKEVTPGVFAALSKRCPRLDTLEMHRHQLLTLPEGRSVVKVFAAALARLADLRVLRLWNYDELYETFPLRALADSCPQLCELGLGNHHGICYRIEDAEYFISSHKTVLQCLSINWRSVEGRSIAPLLPACAETLRSLALHGCRYLRISPEEAEKAFAAVGRLHNLQQLTLDVRYFSVQHLLPALFENGRLPKLEQLKLLGFVVDETTCALTKHCPELRELELVYCEEHSDALFEPLHRLENLGILKIFDCGCIGGKSMSYIAKLPALHTLAFSFIQFDDLKPSLDCILEISGLRRLYLSESDCWAIPFGKFPGRLVNLRELEIDSCDGDQKLLERVCAQMPELKVKGTLRGFPRR